MESKTREMREFVRGLFRGSPDLSVLTQRSIREQFLKHTDQNSIEKEDQKTLKMIVEKELLRMKVDDPRDESLKSEVVAGKSKKRVRSSSCSNSEDGAIKGANSTPPRKPPLKKKQLTSNTGDSSDTEDSTVKEHPKMLPFKKKSSQENLVDGSAMGLSFGKEANVQNGTVSQKAVGGNESELKGFAKKGESDSEGEPKSDCLKMGRKDKMISQEDREQKNRCPRGSPLKVKQNKSSSEEEEVEEEEAKHKVARLPKGKPGKSSSEEGEPKKRARLNASQTDSETEEDEKESKIRTISKKRRLSKAMPAMSSTEEEEEEPTVIEHPKKGRMVKERAVACNAEDDENKKAKKQSIQKRPLKARKAYHSDESNEEDQPKKPARLKGGPLKAKAAASSDDEKEPVKQTSQRGRPSRARDTSHYYESSEEEELKRKVRHSKGITNGSSEEEAEKKPHKKVSSKAMHLDAKKETDSSDEDWDQLEKKGKPLKSKPSSSSDEDRESDKNSVFSKHRLLKAAKTNSSSEEDVKESLAYGNSKQNKAKQAKKSSKDGEEPETKNVSQADGDKEVLKGKGSEMMQRKKMDHASNSDSLDDEDDSSCDDEASPERSGNAHQADQTTKGTAPAKKQSGSSSDDSAEEEPKEKALLPNKMKSGLTQKTKATSRVDKESGSSSNSEAGNRAMKSSTKNQSPEKKGERKDDSDTSSDEDDQVEDEKKDDERTKKHKGKKSSTTAEKEQAGGDEHPSIKRMKRYITACGVRKNYKKLFEGHRSVKSKVTVLKKELEDLGVKGNPTLEKCKVVKLMREEQEELASLDMSNIISKSGRPRRRNAWDPNQTPTTTPPKEHQRCIDSDSEEDAPPRKKRIMDWGNLKGIISDEDESSG